MITQQALQERVKRIQEIDNLIHLLYTERDQLMYEGLTREQHNELFDLVRADGKSHLA